MALNKLYRPCYFHYLPSWLDKLAKRNVKKWVYYSYSGICWVEGSNGELSLLNFDWHQMNVFFSVFLWFLDKDIKEGWEWHLTINIHEQTIRLMNLLESLYTNRWMRKKMCTQYNKIFSNSYWFWSDNYIYIADSFTQIMVPLWSSLNVFRIFCEYMLRYMLTYILFDLQLLT
jgi:hypothetical protein